MEYLVRRTTFDKLERALNALGAEGWAVTAHYVGGRDWVLVAGRAAGVQVRRERPAA